MKNLNALTLLLLTAALTGCATPRPRVTVKNPPAPAIPVEAAESAPAVHAIPAPADIDEKIVEPAVPAEPAIPFRTVVAVQTCLDRNNFSCGVIDGQLSDQTAAALRAWQDSRGLPVTGEIDDATLARVGNLDAEFTTYTVQQSDIDALTDFPTGWREKAARQRLGYATILETVAEKFHAAEQCLQDLNPGVNWPNPAAGTSLVVPKSLPGRYVEVSRISISLSKKELRGFDPSGKEVVLFPCSIAKDVAKRPVGELKIVNAAANPTYTFDPEVFAGEPDAAGITTRLLIPPGPNNPVGLAWVGLDKPGYGIHGTAWPEDIGKTESHGCFRLANWNAQKLVKMIKIGTPVTVAP